MERARTGFSLIELLVVISIIAVLSALMLPAIGVTRQLAKQATCMSNKRQVMAAIIAYAVDNKGLTPPADSSCTTPMACLPRAYWTNLLYNEYLPNDCVAAWQGGAPMNQPSLRWPNVVSCPSFRPQSNPTGFISNTVYGVMWMGSYPGLWCTGAGATRLSSMLGNTPFLADTILTSTKVGSGGYWANQFFVNTVAVYLAHRGQSSVMAYADGHVESLSHGQLVASQVTALWP